MLSHKVSSEGTDLAEASDVGGAEAPRRGWKERVFGTMRKASANVSSDVAEMR